MSDECGMCQGVAEAKRTAIVAVQMDMPNPRWLSRFRGKAMDMLLSNDMVEVVGSEDAHVGEWPFRSESLHTDDAIVAQSANYADWMRFKRSQYVVGEPTAVVNAFAGLVSQSGRYEDVKAAAPVPRTIPDPAGEDRVARLRNSLPEICDLHAGLRDAQLENARLQGAETSRMLVEHARLSSEIAKLSGQSLSGTVRIVTFDGGRAPLQGETTRPELRPLDARKAERHAAELAQISQYMQSHT